MIFGVYVVRDLKTGFMTPTFDINDQAAIRNFKYAVGKTDSLMHVCKSDFDLFKIGDYDSETGEIFEREHKLLAQGMAE